MNFVIKRAAIKDSRIFADVIESVWLQLERKDWFAADNKDYTFRMLKEGNGIGYMALDQDNGNVAGIFLVTFPGSSEENLGRDICLAREELEKVAHMESVAILPEYRGRGLQYRLMQTAEEELKNLGFRYLMCTVHPENVYSKNNVVKQGYQVVLTKEKYDGYLRDILLKKL